MVAASALVGGCAPEQPAAANSKAFGCYTATQAPAIQLDEQGMTIVQQAPIRIGFQIDRPRNDLILTANAPIAASLAGTDYVFLITPRGVGRYLDFFSEIDGRLYGVRDENALRNFTMIAEDGTSLRYRKASPNECRV